MTCGASHCHCMLQVKFSMYSVCVSNKSRNSVLGVLVEPFSKGKSNPWTCSATAMTGSALAIESAKSVMDT